jgi:hypothetical protein
MVRFHGFAFFLDLARLRLSLSTAAPSAERAQSASVMCLLQPGPGSHPRRCPVSSMYRQTRALPPQLPPMLLPESA